MSLKSKCDQYDVAVRELFRLLDYAEETREGGQHRPVQIICARSSMAACVEDVLFTLRMTLEDKG